MKVKIFFLSTSYEELERRINDFLSGNIDIYDIHCFSSLSNVYVVVEYEECKE